MFGFICFIFPLKFLFTLVALLFLNITTTTIICIINFSLLIVNNALRSQVIYPLAPTYTVCCDFDSHAVNVVNIFCVHVDISTICQLHKWPCENCKALTGRWCWCQSWQALWRWWGSMEHQGKLSCPFYSSWSRVRILNYHVHCIQIL